MNKSVLIETIELCNYGCGQIAKYKFKNGKLCCSNHFNKCPINNKKIKLAQKLIPIKTIELCSFGCKQIAKYKLKNGKLCCSDNINKCPINIKKMKDDIKLIPIETIELCSYGCKQQAKYKSKNGKLCCSNHLSKCPINRKRIKNGHKAIPIETNELCNFGCGQISKFKFKNEKLYCSDHYNKCPINRKKNSNNQKLISIITTELCSYGCGQVAKYKLKNGKLCCNDHYNKCLINRKKIKNNMKLVPIETTELCSYECGQIAKYKLKNGKLCCNDHYTKCPNYISKLTIEKIKERYSTSYKVEDLRYNPKKPNEKEIQVRCNYNKCKNSKENNGWFTPTISQISERIKHLEKNWGNDGSYFYCSNKCKEKCYLFGMNPNYIINNNQNIESPHTATEINIWRQEVFQRQKNRDGYNSCEMCGSRIDLQVHHEKPQKTHPGMTLDPDNGIILCKYCHYEIGHKTGTECSTGNLANYNPCN